MHFENNVKRHCYICEDRDTGTVWFDGEYVSGAFRDFIDKEVDITVSMNPVQADDWQTNEVCLQDKLYNALSVCLDALYEAWEIAPLDRLPSKVPRAIQEAQYALNQVDGGSR